MDYEYNQIESGIFKIHDLFTIKSNSHHDLRNTFKAHVPPTYSFQFKYSLILWKIDYLFL